MIKKTITYSDVDGNEIVEDFYFNLSKAEIAEMELSREGGLGAYLQKVVASNNGGQILSTFKEIISKSIGRRSEDGKRFIKSDEISEEFLQTDAYSVLFMEFVTDANSAAEFVQGMLPADLDATLAKIEAVDSEALNSEELPVWEKEDRLPTEAELRTATPDQIRRAFQKKNTQTIGE